MIPKTIDSDAHVIEIPFTWEFMTEAELKHAPFSVTQEGGTEYPTLMLRPYTQSRLTELAMCKSYNRWLAEVWKKGRGRLRWVAMPPLLSMDALKDELAFAKDNGACGIFMRGVEHEKRLSHQILGDNTRTLYGL